MTTILLLTTADTEVLAAAGAVDRLPAGAPAVRALNPAAAPTAGAALDGWLDDALTDVAVAVVRLLGGRAAFPAVFDGVAQRCADRGVPLIALAGEASPDAELTERSTAPTAVVAEAFEYLRAGGTVNTEHLVRFLSDTLLLTGLGFDPPAALPDHGVHHPTRARPLEELDPDRPLVGVVFYRSHLTSGNTAFVDELIAAIERRGAQAVGLYCYSLRPEADGQVPVLATLRASGIRPDALVLTVLATGGSSAADAESWRSSALEELDVPIVQALTSTSTRQRWIEADNGLSPMDTAMQVALPEFDGRLIGVPFSFKEATDLDDRVGGPLVRYVADPERTDRVAGIAVNHAWLGRRPVADTRLALVLSNYPTKHSRIGNGVGLDTPASTVAILRALRDAGYHLGDIDPRFLEDGDALIHELIARGGFDEDLLTDDQLARAEGRLPVEDYTTWFRQLPSDLRARVEEQWGPPPGRVLVAPDGRDLVTAALRFGNVVLAIQPPRGFGEDVVAIYHSPDLPPTHQYLAAYWWLTRGFGADAIVHVGKHGTLEWLPGKGVGLSASCGTDAALTDVPLFYPFVVNDPGEGTQAKRRAHATVVDHLVPPMMRAETYDELTQLEQLLDEYAELELLDPTKLPAIQQQVWELLVDAGFASVLGVEAMPDDDGDFGDLITHVDGYLCEIKDLQVRDGLHVLAAPPEGEQLRGLVGAILRLPQGEVPGLRSVVAAAFGLDEATLLDGGGERIGDGKAVRVDDEVPPDLAGLRACDPGPVVTRGDVLDRVDAVATGCLAALADRGWRAGDADEVTREVLGRSDAGVAAVLRFAADEVVPRVRACAGEIEALLHGLRGGFVPAGPSGSPTRGRLDVLPTGRNFHSVDPKALPSQLSWQVGQRLADALLEGELEATGQLPRSVGIVVWGTANMRTHGDDVAEVLALLGVRPVWHPETRRVVDLELIDLEELGRPRVDVTVRISGFFRDAFPHLVLLMDRAVELVAAADEPGERNPIRAHAADDVRRLVAEGVSPGDATRRSTARIFGAKPGAYGSGLLPLIDARNWRDTADLAEVYTVWSGHAYGRGLDGVEARGDLHANLRRVAVAVKNTDTREHDLLDADDYFQEHGGMVATIRALTGAAPRAVIGDSSDPSTPKARTLAREVDRVFRARVVNPRWIASMQRHGYKGAFELAATVDYLFGYDATTGVVEDRQYATLTERYVLDPEVRGFLERSNPWALHAIAERLLEAADRRLWQDPDPDLLDRLREAYLQTEGDVEDRAGGGA